MAVRPVANSDRVVIPKVLQIQSAKSPRVARDGLENEDSYNQKTAKAEMKGRFSFGCRDVFDYGLIIFAAGISAYSAYLSMNQKCGWCG